MKPRDYLQKKQGNLEWADANHLAVVSRVEK